MSVRAKFQLPSKLTSGEINFPGWGWVAGLIENKANSGCSAELKLELA